MSSFVIDKQTYITAAGFAAGLSDCKNYYREPVVRLWNYFENRVYTAEDFYQAGVWLYRLNAHSVCEQYGDAEAESNPIEYRSEFEAARAKAAHLYQINSMSRDTRDELKRDIYKFMNFTSSVFYQIENPKDEAAAKGFLYRLNFELMKLLLELDTISADEITESSWGEFAI